eukprot:scaffold32567_cov143-Skeletonema_marinoi.AAC.4
MSCGMGCSAFMTMGWMQHAGPSLVMRGKRQRSDECKSERGESEYQTTANARYFQVTQIHSMQFSSFMLCRRHDS